MKAKTRKIEIAKTERRSKRKIRRKEKEKGIEEEEKDRNKEDSGKVGKMGRKIRDSKIREESWYQNDSTSRSNFLGKKQKDVKSHNRFEREIYIKKRKNLSLVQREKRRRVFIQE